MNESDTQPMQYYDTILVDLPAQPGSQYPFFLNIIEKNENLCNVRSIRRLNAGDSMVVQRISLSVSHWSGDCLADRIWKYGWLEVLINNRIVFADALHGWDGSADYEIRITDQDDVRARLCMLAMPSEWGVPKTTDYVEKQRTEEEEIHWPERARWLTKKLGLWAPKLKRTSTWMEPISRPLKGQVTVMLKLIGRGTKPVTQ